ncbi:MAG: hypothetical protein JXK07_07420 [Spirochaetes bacterium]|nr:hypothetical protein [Spirochaetota bacterium]MBN2769683.1 hypothetical protein [Spirochaetota bacterium]
MRPLLVVQHHFEKQSGAGLLADATSAGRKMTLAARRCGLVEKLIYRGCQYLLIRKKPSKQSEFLSEIFENTKNCYIMIFLTVKFDEGQFF